MTIILGILLTKLIYNNCFLTDFMKIILDKFTKKVYSFFTTDNIVTREKSLDYK